MTAVSIFHVADHAVLIADGGHGNGTRAHGGTEDFKGVAAVPDDAGTRRSRAHGTEGDHRFRAFRIFFRSTEGRHKTHRGAGEVFHIVGLGDLVDLQGVLIGVRERLVQEDGLAKRGTAGEVFQMISRIVHFQHQGIRPGNGFIKIFGDFDTHAFEDFLTLVQAFFALERRFKTQAGDHFQRSVVSPFLDDFRESDGVAGIQTDQCDFDFTAHFVAPYLFKELVSLQLSG